jgi:PhzF family phenazine biosynthesis protein
MLSNLTDSSARALFAPEADAMCRAGALYNVMSLSCACVTTDAAAGPLYNLRWFTPAAEVDLCGHATLAAAYALWDTQRVPAEQPIRFATLSGVLTCSHTATSSSSSSSTSAEIALDFPVEPPAELDASSSAELTAALIAALGLQLQQQVKDATTAAAGVLRVMRSRVDLLAEVTPAAFTQQLRPDAAALTALADEHRGVIVTCKGDMRCTASDATTAAAASAAAGADDGVQVEFSSRCFFPRFGIPEDPVTGSAHCCLAQYWADQLGR